MIMSRMLHPRSTSVMIYISGIMIVANLKSKTLAF